MAHQSKHDQIKLLFKKATLFSGISEEDLDKIVEFTEEHTYQPGEFIIYEGDKSHEEFYLIKSGQVAILKKSEDEGNVFCITELSAGETIGEIALLEDLPRTASARAITETTVLLIPIKKLREHSSLQKHYNDIKKQLKQLEEDLSKPPIDAKLGLNLAKNLSKRLSATNVITVEALKEELILSKMQVETGRFLLLLITTLSLYTFFLAILNTQVSLLPSTTIISIPIILIFAGVIIYFMMRSLYPLSFYGLTLQNWQKSVREGIIFSLPLMAMIVFLKWITIKIYFPDLQLFEGTKASFRDLSPFFIIALIFGYFITVPLQEITVRGGLQSSLQQLFSERNGEIKAILISNLIFGMAHLHISFATGLVVTFFGLFWGWLYARHKTLIGVCISHLILGGWAFFVVGVDSILLK